VTRYLAGVVAAAALGFGCGSESPSDPGASPEAVKFVCDPATNPCCCEVVVGSPGRCGTTLPKTDPNYLQCSQTCAMACCRKQNGGFC
jgi:hypothetical protein